MKAKVALQTVSSVDDYKNFLAERNKKHPLLAEVVSLRSSLEKMLSDDSGDLPLFLQRLDEKDKILLITGLIGNDRKLIDSVLSPALLSESVDSFYLPYITLHSEDDSEDQWLNNTCRALINRVLQMDDGSNLPETDCQRIMTLVMEKIPDTLLDLSSKLAIHAELVPVPGDVHIAYKEVPNPLTSNKFSGNIKLDEFRQAVQAPDLDMSEYLFLTLGLLQQYASTNEHVQQQLTLCRSLYMETQYEQAIEIITNLCEQCKKDLGEEVCSAILKVQPELQDVSLYRNYSRRFFENRVAALYQGQSIQQDVIEAVNRIAAAILGNDAKLASNPEEAISVVLSLDDLEHEELFERESKLKEGSTEWEQRGRYRKEGYSSEYKRAMGHHSEIVDTRNMGMMRSGQPNFPDELSEHALENKGPDIYVTSEDSYEFNHKRSVFIASISGHAYQAAALLMIYLDQHPSRSTNTQDINHFLKMYASLYVSHGFHSLLEVMNVFNLPHIKKIFEEQGVQIDTQWPDLILEQAFKDTQEYTKKLCKQRAVGEQLSSRLHGAVERGDLSEVHSLLAQFHDPNKVNARGYTPLWIALKKGYKEITEELMRAGAEPTQSLFIAIKEMDSELVRTLLRHDIDLSLTVEGYNLVEHTNHYGNEEIEELISQYLKFRIEAFQKRIDSIKEDPSNTARQLRIEYLKNFMVDRGQDLDSSISLENLLNSFFILDAVVIPMTREKAEELILNRPFLFAAIEGERDDLVEAALDAGADPNVRLDNGCTPLFWAVEENKEKIVSLLLAKKADVNLAMYDVNYSPLHMAAQNGNCNLIDTLITAGAIVDSDSECCDAPLAMAVKNGHVQAAGMLIDAGADPNRLSIDGTSFLTLAIQNHDFDMINLLLEKGATCTESDKNAMLIDAIYDEQLDMVEFFLSIGASAQACSDYYGEPAICIAARLGYATIAEALLKADANPDAYYHDEDVLLNLNATFVAIKNGHAATVATLLQHGASPIYTVEGGVTLVEYAKQQNEPLIAKLIEDFLEQKMSLLSEQISHINENSDNQCRQEALAALKEYAAVIAKKPHLFEYLQLRIEQFIKLDEQYQRFLNLLSEHKIQRNKIEEVTHCIEKEYNNLKEGRDFFNGADRAKKAIKGAIFQTNVRLFDQKEKELESTPTQQKIDPKLSGG